MKKCQTSLERSPSRARFPSVSAGLLLSTSRSPILLGWRFDAVLAVFSHAVEALDDRRLADLDALINPKPIDLGELDLDALEAELEDLPEVS